MVEYSVIHGIPNPPQTAPAQMLCEKCKGTWFLTHRVIQLQAHMVQIGMQGLEIDPIFFLYECVECTHMTAPPTAYTGFSQEQVIYEELLKVIDAANKRNKCKCT